MRTGLAGTVFGMPPNPEVLPRWGEPAPGKKVEAAMTTQEMIDARAEARGPGLQDIARARLS